MGIYWSLVGLKTAFCGYFKLFWISKYFFSPVVQRFEVIFTAIVSTAQYKYSKFWRKKEEENLKVKTNKQKKKQFFFISN